jgi:glycosyltransferase involved in cell wall biosynthesis
VTGVSVVVPVFNGARTLEPLVARISATLEGQEHEIVLVDDGSADGSWKAIVELANGNDRVRGLAMSRNYGQHAATLAGLRVARFPVTVTIDDDLQNPPEQIPLLLAALEDEDVDVVYGFAFQRRQGFWRNVGRRLTTLTMRAAIGHQLSNYVSSFRAFRTDLRDAFAFFNGPFVIVDVLLTWATSRWTWVEVRHEARTTGASSYSTGQLLGIALTWLTAFSTRPLRIASIVGLATFVGGLGVFAAVMFEYFTRGNPVPGFAFLASIVATLSGAQLFTLGVMGEYVARVHVRVMDRPAYNVRASVGAGVKAEEHA